MTREEKKLWYDFLVNLPVNVNRQKVFVNYIVGFYIPSAKIVIEVDGSQHYDELGRQADEKRDKVLTDLGLLVLRYKNTDIHKKFKSVCLDILEKIKERSN
jgi:very-short-patch-repair endonuclease